MTPRAAVDAGVVAWIRNRLVEMAWCWLRFRAGSAMTRWPDERSQGTGPNRRSRCIATVAARGLVIALWRYLKDGVLPMKPVQTGLKPDGG